jgi:phosphatidylglycerophosphate synthase
MYDNKYFTRRLVSPLINFFKKTNISAEELTLFRIFFGVFTALIISIGTYFQYFLITLLYQFVLLLDYVDGSIAREKGTFKIRWVYLDLVGHIVLSFLFILAITLSYYFRTGDIFFLTIGCFTGVLFLFNNILNKKSHLDMWKEVHKNAKKYERKGIFSLAPIIKIERPFGIFFVFVLLNLNMILIPLYFIIYLFVTINKFFSEFNSLKNEKYK